MRCDEILDRCYIKWASEAYWELDFGHSKKGFTNDMIVTVRQLKEKCRE